MLNPVRERAFIVWHGFAHSASSQKHCCFSTDWGTTIFRNWYSRTQDAVHRSALCADHYHNKSPTSAITTLARMNAVSPPDLKKAGKDVLCANPRKLAKERRWTGSLYILSSSCSHLFSPEMKEAFSHFQIRILLSLSKIQHKSLHMLSHDILSPR